MKFCHFLAENKKNSHKGTKSQRKNFYNKNAWCLLVLAALGKIVIYSSHILEVVEKLCRRVIVIYKGTIAADDSVQQLRSLMHLPSLESIFKELVRQEDTKKSAREVISIIQS